MLQLRDCEERESCLSGRGRGGRGSVTKALEEQASRAGHMASELKRGEKIRQESIVRLNTLLDEFQGVFSNAEKSFRERRPELVALDAKIRQELATLDEALPLSLLLAYHGELEHGMLIHNRPVATKKLNSLLFKQAESLDSVLSSINRDVIPSSAFPPLAGVSTTFAYISHFLPIAALTAFIELIFPLTLWVYVLLELVWVKHKLELSAYVPTTTNGRMTKRKTKQETKRTHASASN